MSIRGISIKDLQDSSMLTVEEAQIDFTISNIFSSDETRLDEAILYNANFHLIRNPESTRFNIQEFVQNINESFGGGKKNPIPFYINDVRLYSTSFTLWDPTKPLEDRFFDINHFTIRNIKSEVTGLLIHRDTVEMRINKFTGQEPRNALEFHSIIADLSVHPDQLALSHLEASFGKSFLSDSVVFSYSNYASMGDFVDSVDLSINFKNSVLSSDQVALFFPVFHNYDDVYTISGFLKGKVRDLKFNNLDLTIGQESLIKGNLLFKGLPDIENTYIAGDIAKSRIKKLDLKQYLPDKIYENTRNLDDIYFSGNVSGNIHDFDARGEFDTNLGQLNCDLNLKIPNSGLGRPVAYSGSLGLNNFDLESFFDNSTFQKVTLQGKIDGRGFSLDDANFKLEGTIDQIGINQYTYTNIKTNATFAKEFFDGAIDIQDPNLKIGAMGSIDLREGKNQIKVKGQIDTVNFKPLNLLQKDLFLSTDIDIDITGLKIDSVQGKIIAHNTTLINQQREFFLDSLNLVSTRDQNKRVLNINSSDFNVEMDGNFDFTTSFKDLKSLAKEFKLSLKNNRDSLSSYYGQLSEDQAGSQPYVLNYYASLKDINPILEFLTPEIHVSKNSVVQGSFHSGYTSIFSLITSADTIHYKKSSFYNSNLDLSASKIRDSTDILAMVYLYSKKQNLAELTQTKNLTMDGVWDNNHIDFNFNLEQEKLDNFADIYGSIDFMQDSTVIHIKRSDIQALNEAWKIDETNLITAQGKEISIHNLKIYNKQQSLELNGNVSQDPENKLVVQFNKMKLQNVNPLINKNLSGIVDGHIILNNVYKEIHIESALRVDTMKINDFLVGNIDGISKWHSSDKHFDVVFKVEREQKKIINVEGTYEPLKGENSLDLQATFDQANLKIIEPFVESIFSSITGTVSGDFTVKGTPLEPLVQGKGKVNDGGVLVNYLNTYYKVQGDIAFTQSTIKVQNVILTDEDQNNAFLTGEFTHNGFRQFALNLSGRLENFQVLNTTSKDNDLFYGTGKVTGEVNFSGPLTKLLITARAQTDRGTRLFIPIGDSGNIESTDYVSFVDFSKSDSTREEKIEKEKVNLKGLIMDFDLVITPDAYSEMIFDIQSGDIIRGRGNGNIKLQIDTRGDFNMIGDYEFVSGGYNFTLYNIINKEFTILPKSSISWAGDPYGGILNMKATYSQMTSLAPLFIETSSTAAQDQSIAEAPEIKRRYPTDVLLSLTGPLMSPNIEFDIQVRDYPENINVSGQTYSLGSLVSSFENKIHTDEQELKRQVFSLLILRNFSSQNQLVTGGSFAINSVSEFLSNQLSYWITQVDENLDIDVDLGELDQEGFATFQVRLSYTFLDGRLRITRDGGFTDSQNNANLGSIAGDWTVEYSLTPEGKFRVKMYNRNNTSSTTQALSQQSTFTAGISLIHTQSFNEIKDIFNKSRKIRTSQKDNTDSDHGSSPDSNGKPNN